MGLVGSSFFSASRRHTSSRVLASGEVGLAVGSVRSAARALANESKSKLHLSPRLSLACSFFTPHFARRWNKPKCLPPTQWCQTHVHNGVANSFMSTCRSETGVDFLMQFCIDCFAPNNYRPPSCVSLEAFVIECTEQCTTQDSASNVIFQAIACLSAIDPL